MCQTTARHDCKKLSRNDSQDKATITIGIPYLSGPESIDFTSVQQFTTAASTKTEKITSSIPAMLDQLVPGMTAQVVTAKVPAGAITVQVRKRQLQGGRKLDACYAMHVHVNCTCNCLNCLLLTSAAQVPITVKTTYTCNNVTTQQNTVILKTSGVVKPTANNLKISYGPQ